MADDAALPLTQPPAATRQLLAADVAPPADAAAAPPLAGRGGGPATTVALAASGDDTGQIAAALRRAGASVRTLARADDAWACAGRGEAAALLVGDDLADVDGDALVASLRDQPEPPTPVLRVTSQPPAQWPRILAAGATDVVSLHAPADELVVRVRAHTDVEPPRPARLRPRRRHVGDLTHRLLRVPGHSSVRDAAQAIADEVARTAEVDGCAVAAIPAHGAPVTLAASGDIPSHDDGGDDPPCRHAVNGHDARGVAVDRHGVAWAAIPGAHEALAALGVSSPRGAETAAEIAAAAAPPAAATLWQAAWGPGADLSAIGRLDTIIDARRFSPVFQPIVRVSDGATVAFEALTRFDDGASAAHWFAAARAAGRGDDLERVTAEAALRAARALPEQAAVTVNMSPSALRARVLDHAIDAAGGTDGRPVVVELTEHEQVDDYPAVRREVAHLRARTGAWFAVDDAGAGYASLQHILALRPQFVKLDRDLVRGLHRDPARHALAAGMARFADGAGCGLVGEGVEQRRELAALDHAGVPYAQGFGIGRPAAAQTWARR